MKSFLISIFVVFVLMISFVIVSVGWFGDIYDRITGNTVLNDGKII